MKIILILALIMPMYAFAGDTLKFDTAERGFSTRFDGFDGGSVTSWAGTAIKNGVNQVDTSSLFREMYGDIRYAIGALASSLKVGSEHVYKVLVKQQVANSIVWLILWVLDLICIYLSIKLLTSVKDWTDPSARAIAGIMGSIGSGCLLIACFAHIPTIVTGFVNPEYGAMQDIINMVKSVKS